MLCCLQSAVAQTYTLPASGTAAYTTCSGVLYDDGGPSNPYSPSANGTVTLTPATAGNKIRLQFNQFFMESGYDRLTIYDGSTTSAPVIGTYDYQNPGTVYATNSAGTLTLRFTSDSYSQYSGFAADIACVTTVPQADLAVQGASVQPLSVVPGTSLSVNCTVYNLSAATAQGSSVGYYLSSDPILDANDQLIGSSVGNTLAGNQSSYRTNSLTLPASTPTGSYYVLFVADYQNVVSESNEANNVASVSVSIVPPVTDLVIQQAYISTTSTAPGNVLGLSCNIVNQGNITANFSSVGFYLSTNTTLDANDQLLASAFGSQLSPSYSQYRTVSTNVPPGTAPGAYYILFVADYQGVVPESIETNNITAASIAVVPPSVDLVVSQAQLSLTTVMVGSAASISTTAYVSNQGNTSAAASNLGIYLSTDGTLSANDQLLTTGQISGLSAAERYYSYGQFALPSTLAAGTYYVLFAADYQNQVGETDETNNVRSVMLTVVTPSIDLTTTQPSATPTNVAPGNSFSVSSYASNQGNTLASSFSTGYYLSANSTLDATDVLIGSSTVSSVYASGYANVYGNATIPVGTPTGSYYILFVTDYLNQITETNETNNVTALPLTVVPAGIDFVISQPSLSRSSAGANTVLTAYATIYNQGTTTAAYSSIGFYLSTNTTFDASDVLLTSVASGSLGPNGYVSRSATFTIPSTVTAGSYYVLYVADHQAQVAETNETNNVSAVPLLVTAPFNGVVVPFSGTNTITTCSSTVYDHAGNDPYYDGANGALVINPGTVGAKVQLVFQSFSVESCCDRLTIYDGPNTQSPVLGYYSYNPGTVTATSTNTTGALTLHFTSDGSVTGSGFEASVLCVNGTNTGLQPDFVPSQPTVGTTAVAAGSSLSVSTQLRNQGTGAAASSPLGYYLSTNTTFESTDLLIGSNNGSAVLSGQSYVRSGQYTIPASIAPGTYYLLHVADPQNTVLESDETNNVVSNALTVTSALPDLLIAQPSLSASSALPGGTVNATCLLINQGDAMAASSTIGYYLSTDATWGSGDVLLTSGAVSSVTSGAVASAAASLRIPAGTPAGSYYVLFVADHLAAVSEGVEGNNVNFRPLSVTIVQSSRDEQLAGLTLAVYPNPTTASTGLKVAVGGDSKGKTVLLGLYNALGQRVAQQQVKLTGTPDPITFDTSGLSRGVYMLRVTGADLNATRRVVIE
ncbi:CARDB domain-containing protein [Hymenobacter mucosus]|nr:CARDB domain-containing protein [Hymenobacter mucosus]